MFRERVNFNETLLRIIQNENPYGSLPRMVNDLLTHYLADPNYRTEDNKSCIHLIVENSPPPYLYENPEVSKAAQEKLNAVMVLIENGADIFAQDKHGKTAWYYALKRNDRFCWGIINIFCCHLQHADPISMRRAVKFKDEGEQALNESKINGILPPRQPNPEGFYPSISDHVERLNQALNAHRVALSSPL